MITVSIARRYARALLDLASEQNQLEPVGQSLDSIGRAFNQSAELRAIMSNPAVPAAGRAAVLGKLLEQSQAHPLAANLLRLLVDRNRASYIESVAREFRAMVDQRIGRLRAKVTTAVPLDDAALEKIRVQLAAITNKQVTVERVVDPKILGGVVAQVGSTTFDGSLQSQLEGMRRQLLS